MDEIKRMQELMNYNIDEDKTNNKINGVEYSVKGSDGKTYGIIHEGNHFYIKVAPPKNNKIMFEDYDYIGGYMNKKAYEYNSYAIASKQLDLKLMSINESCNNKQKSQQIFKAEDPSEWQINETKEMRKEINRINQISENVNSIISEGVTSSPVGLGFGKQAVSFDGGNPYNTKNNHDGTKDMHNTSTKPSSNSDPYSEKLNNCDIYCNNGEPKSKKHSNGNVYDEEAKNNEANNISDSVATKKIKPSMKPVKENKKHNIKLTESQILAWNKNKDYIDKSHGTEIGSSAPYEECGNSCNNMNKKENIINIKNGKARKYTSPYNEIEYEIDTDDVNEDELHDFGEHPAYQKTVMTTLPNKEVSKIGHEWDDESVKGDKPFGQNKGNSSPYTEKLIDKITDEIVECLSKKKK